MRYSGWLFFLFCYICSSFGQSQNVEKTYLSNGIQLLWMPVAVNEPLQVVFFVKNQQIIEEKVGVSSIVSEMILQQKTTKGIPDIVSFQKSKGISLYRNGTFIRMSFRQEDDNEALNLFYQILTKPSFSEPGLDQLRQDFMTPLNREDSTELIAEQLFKKFTFGFQHPSSNFIQQKDIFNIKTADLLAFHQKAYTPKNVFMVISGHYDRVKINKTIDQTFGKWNAVETAMPIVKTNKPPVPNQLFLTNNEGAKNTKVVIGYPLDVNVGTEDVRRCYLLEALIKQIFKNNGFQQIQVELNPERYSGKFMLSFQSPHEMVKAKLDQSNLLLKDIYLGRISEGIFESVKKEMVIKWTTLTEIDCLEEALLLCGNGNIDFEPLSVQNWKDITIEQVKLAAFKYLKPTNLNMVILGDIESYYDSLNPLGNVQIVNEQGMSAKYKPKEKKWSIHPQIQNYLKVCNAELFLKYKNARISYVGEFFGKAISLEQFQEVDFTYFSIRTAEMNIREQSCNGKKAISSEFGQSIQVDTNSFADIHILTQIFPEAVYEKWSVGVSSKEVIIENSNLIELTIIFPSQRTILSYFSKETGLKMKTIFSKKVNGVLITQEIGYSNYQSTPIGKLPGTILIKENGMVLKLDLHNIEVDINKSDYDFTID